MAKPNQSGNCRSSTYCTVVYSLFPRLHTSPPAFLPPNPPPPVLLKNTPADLPSKMADQVRIIVCLAINLEYVS
jgi:hypothetical protein